MKTSYFAKYKGADGVSIAGKCPEWFTGREFKKLAPKYWFFKRYIDSDKGPEAQEAYKKAYREEVLDLLDPQEVYEALKDCVLLCWERAGVFCHRRLVAEWLYEKLGVIVDEL